MLQITLDSTVQKNVIQSANPNNWGFKLKVVNEGDSAELRISFFDGMIDENMNMGQETLPSDNNIIGEPLS